MNKKLEKIVKKTSFIAMKVIPKCPRCENTWDGFGCHKCNYKPEDEETSIPFPH